MDRVALCVYFESSYIDCSKAFLAVIAVRQEVWCDKQFDFFKRSSNSCSMIEELTSFRF